MQCKWAHKLSWQSERRPERRGKLTACPDVASVAVGVKHQSLNRSYHLLSICHQAGAVDTCTCYWRMMEINRCYGDRQWRHWAGTWILEHRCHRNYPCISDPPMNSVNVLLSCTHAHTLPIVSTCGVTARPYRLSPLHTHFPPQAIIFQQNLYV